MIIPWHINEQSIDAFNVKLTATFNLEYKFDDSNLKLW